MDKSINNVGWTCFNTADSMTRHRSPVRLVGRIKSSRRLVLRCGGHVVACHATSDHRMMALASRANCYGPSNWRSSSRWTTEQKRRRVPNKNSRPISRASSMHTPWRVTTRRGKTASHNRIVRKPALVVPIVPALALPRTPAAGSPPISTRTSTCTPRSRPGGSSMALPGSWACR